jgi:Protein of unknown function (DUF2505)
MPEVTLRHEFDCDEQTYWDRTTFDPVFNERLYRDVLKFPGYELLSLVDDENAKTRRVRIDPPLGNLPAAVKKAVGDRFSYVEEGRFDKKTGRYEFKIAPSAMRDKAKTFGELWCEKLGDKRVARIAHVTVEVKVFMVGGLVEEKILGDVRHSYEAAARFTREYLKELGLSA